MIAQIVEKVESLPRKEKSWFLVGLALYVFSFTQPAFTTQHIDGVQTIKGYEAFLMGGPAFLVGGLLEGIIWLANPFILVSLLFFLKGRSKGYLSIPAVLLAASFYLWKNILGSESGETVPILS